MEIFWVLLIILIGGVFLLLPGFVIALYFKLNDLESRIKRVEHNREEISEPTSRGIFKRLAYLEEYLKSREQQFRQMPGLDIQPKMSEVTKDETTQEIPQITQEEVEQEPKQKAEQETPLPDNQQKPPIIPYAGEDLLSPETVPASDVHRASLSDLEARLGGNWLNKIGVVIFVIGIVFLIGYSFQFLGAAGKILIGYLVSAALLTGGILLERKNQFSLYGKGLIGGGWALLYFTTYAMHYLPAVRIVENDLLALIMLGVVSFAMIWHSLAYKSQVITGISYFLGFVTVGISHVAPYSVWGSFFLTASLIFICVRFRWYYLGLGGVITTYVMYIIQLALWSKISAGSNLPYGMTNPLSMHLLLYWPLFMLPNYISSPDEGGVEDKILQIANILNATLFLILMNYQIQDAQLRFYFVMLFGVVYIILAFYSKQANKRTSFLLFSTIAAALFFAAVPLKISGDWMTVIWWLEAELFMLAGFYLHERYFRGLAGVIAAIALCRFIFNDLFVTSEFLLAGWNVYHKTITALTGMFLFYINSFVIYPRFSRQLFKEELNLSKAYSWVATLLLLGVVYFQSQPMNFSIWWSAAGAILFFIGLYSSKDTLRQEGLVVVAFGLLWFIIYYWYGITASFATQSYIDTYRFRNALVIALILFFVNILLRRAYKTGTVHLDEYNTGRVFSYFGSALVLFILRDKLPESLITISWGLFGVFMIESWRRWQEVDSRMRGSLMVIASLIRYITVDISMSPEWHFILPYHFFVAMMIVCYCYYIYFVLCRERKNLFSWEKNSPEIFSWLAVFTLIVLSLEKLDKLWVAASWSAMAVFYLLLGITRGVSHFRHLSYALFGLSTLRLPFVNFTVFNAGIGAGDKTITTALAVFFQYAYYGIFSLMEKNKEAIDRLFEKYAFYAATVFMVIFTYQDAPKALLTVYWGMEGLFLFSIGLFIGKQMFRLCGVSLLFICVLKIFFVDLSGLDTFPRIISFIVLGIILLLVSYLYTRYSDFIKKYL